MDVMEQQRAREHWTIGPTARIAIIRSDHNRWAETVFRAVRQQSRNEYFFIHTDDFATQTYQQQSRYLYVPPLSGAEGTTPNLAQAESDFQILTRLKRGTLVLISSALIYGTGPERPPFAAEEYSAARAGGPRIADRWNSLETLVRRSLDRNVCLTVLRPVAVAASPTIFSRLLSRRFVPTLPGHDPVLQLLSLSDLAEAIDCAFEQGEPGIFNLAPDDVVPLHAGIRAAGSHRTAIPRTVQRLVRRSEVLDYLRYPWTVSNEKAKKKLGFAPAQSSLAALLALRRQNGNRNGQTPEAAFDEFGMDRDYIRFYGKMLFRFLSDYYWRIELKGLEHVPREGRAVLVGAHRGFMPWDGVMALHLLVREAGRYPRFLTHPCLLKFPFMANFMTKLGGVVACQQSADLLLQSENLLGIFPEGIQGAFTFYRQAYQLQEFGRDAYVKIALRNRAPLVPFVTVGSAEIFPIWGKIKSRPWSRYTGWPCLPLTATFPLLPVPLPSKWHTQFLPPMHIEKEHPPEAAQDSRLVKAISLDVRSRMQQAINEMLGRRRSIFFGSIFEAEAGE
jgi:1-acyl-sn-glycerol-3-phosphate acyltransferase